MRLTFVVAVSNNNVIGDQNKLPWYIPEDLKHFKQITSGKTVLMGKNTYNSIIKRLKKPLPGRKNIVVTRNKDFNPGFDDVVVYNDLDDALTKLHKEDEVMVIGGGQIYNQLIDKADKLIITHVHQTIEGDVFFPSIEKDKWKLIAEEKHGGFSFAEYERA